MNQRNHETPDGIWPAPQAVGPIHAVVNVPGSKSLTNRHLVIAALGAEPSTVSGVLDSRDTRLMITALEQLGARIAPSGSPCEFRVTPLPRGRKLENPILVDMGLAGTVMRFIPPLAGLVQGVIHCDGDPQARVRPMQALLQGVRQLGVEIADSDDASSEAPESLPFTILGQGHIPGGRVMIDSSASSQFISGLLLTASACDHGMELVHTGEHTPSPEHVAMTVKVLAQAGVPVDDSQPNRWVVPSTTYSPPDVVVEPDLSNAGPFLAAALVTGGTVEIPHWPLETTQIGDRWREILPAFGATVTLDPVPGTGHGILRVSGGLDSNSQPIIRGAGIIEDTAELAPTVAALAILADGDTELTGIGHLRGHETDRLHAVAHEASKVGARVVEGPDYLRFAASSTFQPAVLKSWADHRMATFAAILGLAIPGIDIEDVATTSKTMPRFPLAWSKLVSSVDPSHPEIITG